MTPERGDVRYEVVIPTAGRPALATLLAALGAAEGPLPERVLLVDDRPEPAGDLELQLPGTLAGRTFLLRSGGRGPAAARNVGWRAARADWVAFLDDDVIPPPGWRADLARDLRGLPATVVGSQGRIRVPLPRDRAPTDWERNVAGLEEARWATADLAYRRSALAAVGGFDERFPRAYREDSDLGLRLAGRGLEIVRGERCVLHPVRRADRWTSLRKQVGNADDALMDAFHGSDWRERAGAPPGRFRRHAAVTAAGAIAAGAALAGASRTAGVAGAVWLTGTAELAWARIAPGPRTRDELTTMALTSAALPAVATAHRLHGMVRARRLARSAVGVPVPEPPEAVLLDRDGTLIADVPYNGDPDRVRPLPGAREALDRLRAAGIRLAIVSNQSGIARGMLAAAQVEAVMARVVDELGPFDDVRWCPHAPGDGCRCRKPAPGLLTDGAAALGADPLRCAMVGDIGADVEAARAAGMRSVLVPTPITRGEEIAAAPERAATLAEAVDLLLRRPDAAGSSAPVPVVAPPRRAPARCTAGPAPAADAVAEAVV
ncbi:MAG TPA: HAD-IIIA family hydrolase [Baekduia sp.]|nr:HAD-IIIA family hydrolase [Baekduia sp.]